MPFFVWCLSSDYYYYYYYYYHYYYFYYFFSSRFLRLFWFDRNLEKARDWLENKVLRLDSDLGDAWATLYKFEVQHGTKVCECFFDSFFCFLHHLLSPIALCRSSKSQ